MSKTEMLSATNLIAQSDDLWMEAKPILEFSGKSTISQLYEYTITIQCDDALTQIGVGISITGKICDTDITLYGYNSCMEMFIHRGIQYYKITITPSMHMLAFAGKPRIFTNKTIIEIIDYILLEYEMKSVNMSAVSLAKKTYCVQYNQTDLEFIESLLAENGLLYAFQHTTNGSNLVIFNNCAQLQLIAAESFYFAKSDNNYDDYLISGVSIKQQYTPMGYMQIYNNFQQASQALLINTSIEGDQNNALFNQNNMMQYALLGHLNLAYAEITSFTLNTHMRYHLMKAKILELVIPRYMPIGMQFCVQWSELSITSYIVIEVEHIYTNQQALGSTVSKTIVRAVESTVIVTAAPHAKPIIAGVHRGIVICPDNKETYTDQWGRVCVRFFWSNEFMNGDMSMDNICWVRPTYAGATTNGFYYVPRAGDEVLVSFEDGDPERPYLLNALYNSSNVIPYNPEMADINFWRMSQTGNDQAFNEISFNADAQQGVITINAFNNFVTTVQSNWTETIILGNYIRSHQQGDYTHTMQQGNYTYTNQSGNYTSVITNGNVTETVSSGNVTRNINGNYSDTMSGNNTISINGSSAITINDSETVNISGGSAITISGGANLSISLGSYHIKVTEGLLSLESDTEISFHAPIISFDTPLFMVRSIMTRMTSSASTNITSGDFNVSSAATNIECAEFSVDSGAAIDLTAGAAMAFEATAALDLTAGAAISIEGPSMEIAAAMVMIG